MAKLVAAAGCFRLLPFLLNCRTFCVVLSQDATVLQWVLQPRAFSLTLLSNWRHFRTLDALCWYPPEAKVMALSWWW
jgi:hypothetical protein